MLSLALVVHNFHIVHSIFVVTVSVVAAVVVAVHKRRQLVIDSLVVWYYGAYYLDVLPAADIFAVWLDIVCLMIDIVVDVLIDYFAIELIHFVCCCYIVESKRLGAVCASVTADIAETIQQLMFLKSTQIHCLMENGN